jgi:hypothetical protein
VKSVPLAVSRERVILYGGALAFFAFITPVLVLLFLKLDLAKSNWQNLQAGGATAGTPDLLNPQLHAAWQIAHDLPMSPFAYPPGVAWLYRPIAHLPLLTGIEINGAIVVAACALAAIFAARAFQLPLWFALLAVFAWEPAIDSIQTGETGAVAMLLAFVTVYGLVRNRPVLAGCAIGLMLFKPSIAVAFLLLLAVRGQWRALLAAGAVAAVWFVAGVTATQGDWAWPVHYAQMIGGYFAHDFQLYAIAGMTLPAMLMRIGVPSIAASAAGALLFAIALPFLRRTPVLQATSMTGLLALAASPHAWGYDGALVLPSLFFAMTALREPARTRAIIVAYVLAALQVYMTIEFAVNPLAVIVIGGAFWWLALQIWFGSTSAEGAGSHDNFARARYG